MILNIPLIYRSTDDLWYWMKGDLGDWVSVLPKVVLGPNNRFSRMDSHYYGCIPFRGVKRIGLG